MSIEKSLSAITRFLEYMCTFFFGIMCLALSIQVIMRYGFGGAPFWVEELARYSMVWIVFLGSAVAVARAAHTRIDFFVNLLPKPARAAAGVLVDCLCIVFLALLIVHCLPLLKIGMIMKATALNMPMTIVYASLPVGCALMIAYFLRDIFHAHVACNQQQGENR